METPQTFEALYLKACDLTEDFPLFASSYRDLDSLREYIDSKEEDEKLQYLHAISDQRTCIVLPYEMFIDKRRPPDGTTKNGTQIIYACPGWDQYISDLIDHMENDLEVNPQKTESFLIKWKILRLSKMYKLGWDAFSEQYLAPFI